MNKNDLNTGKELLAGDVGYGSEEGYGYRYDYQGEGGYGLGGVSKQTLRDYLLVLRDKVWYFILTFLVVFAGAVIYSFKATPIYESLSVLHVLRDDQSVLGVKSIEANDIKSIQDLNTQIKVMESLKVVNGVADRLRGKDLRRFFAPYEGVTQLLGPLTTHGILHKNRKVIPMRASLMVGIRYRHPDPEIAANVANLFANEYINYNVKLDVENSMKAVDDLKIRVDQQRLKVEDLEGKMAEYREKHSSISLDAQADVDHQELGAINIGLTQSRVYYDEAKVRWKLIEGALKRGERLEKLSFISNLDQVQSLLAALSNRKIEVSSLGKRYREKHPSMIEVTRALKETENELASAINIAKDKVYNDYVYAKDNYNNAVKRLEEKQGDIIKLGKIRVEYSSLQRDLEVNQSLYQSLVMRMNTELAQINLKRPNARVIDKATPSISPKSPNIMLILPIGLLGGIVLGLGVVMIAVHIDDRAKSIFDVESVIGMPLVGVIPRVKLSNSLEKIKLVASRSDRYLIEAFRSIYSALKLNEVSKEAKVIVCTSTAPSEGKTFFVSNLASMFASHNEKCLLIDCDLRMPSIGNLLKMPIKVGIMQYCKGEASLEDIICKDTPLGLDVIASGGKSITPTEILASDMLEELVDAVKTKYDRIFIDTPPLGAVSDALSVLPLADGLLYVIKFNSISRGAIKKNYERILKSKVPVFGGVVNQVSLTMANYYYSHYYHRSYNSYYLNTEEVNAEKEEEKKLIEV